MKRRSFLKNTLATTAGAFVVPTIVPLHVIGKNPPSDKINIGQIGCGRIARSLDLRRIMEFDTARVIACCDVDSKRLKDGKELVENYYANKTGKSDYVDVKMYEDYREMLLRSDIDAVIISTPDHWHALMAPRPFLVSGGNLDTSKRWIPLNHTIAVNRLLKFQNRVAMTNRSTHSPDSASNEQAYLFLEYFLKDDGIHSGMR